MAEYLLLKHYRGAPAPVNDVPMEQWTPEESCRERGRWILLAWPAGVSAAYPSSMVNPTLQSAIEAMSLDERLELVEYIESTVDQSVIEVTEEQKAMIRSRAAELQADPSIGLDWDELKARLAARRA